VTTSNVDGFDCNRHVKSDREVEHEHTYKLFMKCCTHVSNRKYDSGFKPWGYIRQINLESGHK